MTSCRSVEKALLRTSTTTASRVIPEARPPSSTMVAISSGGRLSTTK